MPTWSLTFGTRRNARNSRQPSPPSGPTDHDSRSELRHRFSARALARISFQMTLLRESRARSGARKDSLCRARNMMRWCGCPGAPTCLRLGYGPGTPSSNRAFYVLIVVIRLDRRLSPASRSPQQLDPANSRGRNCFGGECPQKRARRRFLRSPQKNSHKNEYLDVSRR